MRFIKNVQSRYCALSVKGWEVALKRRILSAMQCRVRCHIKEIIVSIYSLCCGSLPFKEKEVLLSNRIKIFP